MTAVDTNVVVRMLTRDDPRQAAHARALFAADDIWIAKTVLLETAWVLSSVYGFDPSPVQSALTKLLGLPNVKVEDPGAVTAALRWVSAGIEFADALHLESKPVGARFVTFDEIFVRRAQKAGAEIDAPQN